MLLSVIQVVQLFQSLQSHRGQPYHPDMIVQLSHPARQVEVKGPKRTKDLLRELNLVVEAHLVIRGDDLVTEDEMLSDADQIEIRPVISGGSNTRQCGVMNSEL
jgi:sulfur carrier protein